MDSLTALYTDRWTDRQTDGLTDRFIHRQMDRQTDRWKDKHIYIRCLYEPEMMFASITGGGGGGRRNELSRRYIDQEGGVRGGDLQIVEFML